MDHPPMVALLAALTAGLADYPLAARLGPIACSILTVFILCRLVLVLYGDERLALTALLVLLVLPYQHLLMVALLPDATLALFWCCGLFTFWMALQDNRHQWWVLTGLSFGGCLLSKYHGVLLPGCFFLYLVFSNIHRKRLLTPGPWLGFLIGLLLFVPNILWNYRHDWISYRFQLARTGSEQISIDRIFEVLGAQLGVWSPLMAILLWTSLTVILIRPRLEADRYLFWTSAPVFLLFYLSGMSKSILPHWVAVGWWSGSVAMAVVISRVLTETKGTLRKYASLFIRAGAVIGLCMSLVLYLGLFVPVVQPAYRLAQESAKCLQHIVPQLPVPRDMQSEQDLSNELFGWEQAAAEILNIAQAMPRPDKTFLVSDRFYTISQLAVYFPGDQVVITLRNQLDQHRLWHDPKQLKGWDALYIEDRRFSADKTAYARLFDQTEGKPMSVQGYRRKQPVRQLKVYRMYGYQGVLLP
jgi:hypothetical protein